MTQALTTTNAQADAVELALIQGDLSKLTPAERLAYYRAVCESLKLNPYTKPFAYITLNNKLVLYALKDCTEQLRKNNKVSINRLDKEIADGCYVVTAYATDKDERTDSSIGAVNIEGLKGEARANAMMKAETKAKRRVTLSICGLGMLDETEIETIPDARRFDDDAPTVSRDERAPAPPTSNGKHEPPPTTTPTPVSAENRAILSQLIDRRDAILADAKAKGKNYTEQEQREMTARVIDLMQAVNVQLTLRNMPTIDGKQTADKVTAIKAALNAMLTHDESAPQPEAA